jgi:putative ABC transport system substrate-binding protein
MAQVFVALLVLALLAAPLAAEAQPAAKVSRIGYLSNISKVAAAPLIGAFQQGLRDLGYQEGRNLVTEDRSEQGGVEQFPALIAELARLRVDVIFVAGGTPAARAAKQATSTIPIVAPALGDPVGDELVASLARPGGNITGSTFLGPELVAKRLQLLKEAIAGVSRVAALWHPGAYGIRTMDGMLKETEIAAQALGVHLHRVEVRSPNDLDGAFSTMVTARTHALFVFPSPMFYAEYKRIVDLAGKHRLPAIYVFREAVDIGGLIAYGASIPDLFRRAALHVDRILKGARPADLPVEQPTKFELVINLKAAKALGLTIPQSVLLRADEVIQ